jgi:hypothetical protein
VAGAAPTVPAAVTDAVSAMLAAAIPPEIADPLALGGQVTETPSANGSDPI